MRARNIKPGFFENEQLAELPFEARLLFIGLWCIADREGRFEWRPKRMKALLFPYDTGITPDVIECHLMSLHVMTLILQYKLDDSLYGVIPNFKKHQNPHPHEAKSILPNPLQGEILSTPQSLSNAEKSSDSNVMTCNTNVMKCNADILNPDSNTIVRHDKGGNGKTDPSEQSPVFITIPLNKQGSNYPITERNIAEFQELYPAVDVRGEVKKCKAWNIANPKNRKTSGGIMRHVNAWLSRAQNNAKAPGPKQKPANALPDWL